MSELLRPEVLISRLGGPNEGWRLDAETRLVALGESAVPTLLGATGHPHVAVRLHAVRALARIQSPRGLPAILEALADTENHCAVAIAAEKALIHWGEPVKAALLEAAREGPVAIRSRALRALGKIGGDELPAALSEFLADESGAVRLQTALALAEVSGEACIELLRRLLDDRDQHVRFAVAEALVGLGSTLGEEVLLLAVNDPDEEDLHVQYQAQQLLEEIAELKRAGANCNSRATPHPS